MDLRTLRYFVAVAEEGSYTRAAVRLGVSQPTLSAAVQRLEGELGGGLLDRSHHPVRPTAAGLVALQHAVRVLECVASLQEAVRTTTGAARGPVRVGVFGVGAGPMTVPLLQALGAVSRTAPVVQTLGGHEQVSAVADGVVDLALVHGPCTDERVVATPLAEVPRVAVVGLRHPLADAEQVTVADLLDQPVLTAPPGEPREWQDSWALVPERGGEQPRRLSTPGSHDVAARARQLAVVRAAGLAPVSAVDAFPAAHLGLRYVPIADAAPTTALLLTRRGGDPVVQEVAASAVAVARGLRPAQARGR